MLCQSLCYWGNEQVVELQWKRLSCHWDRTLRVIRWTKEQVEHYETVCSTGPWRLAFLLMKEPWACLETRIQDKKYIHSPQPLWQTLDNQVCCWDWFLGNITKCSEVLIWLCALRNGKHAHQEKQWNVPSSELCEGEGIIQCNNSGLRLKTCSIWPKVQMKKVCSLSHPGR